MQINIDGETENGGRGNGERRREREKLANRRRKDQEKEKAIAKMIFSGSVLCEFAQISFAMCEANRSNMDENMGQEF